jgi:FtsP/CotA-like multicopper oxidase with cupredoxin domain
MEKRRFSIFMRLVLIAIALFWVVGQAGAEEGTYQKRKDAWDRLREAMKERHALSPSFPETPPQPESMTPRLGIAKTPAKSKAGVSAMAVTPTGFNPAVNMDDPNFANSPNLRKFINGLPGLGYANRNNLNQYIPVADADTTTYPGSHYYEIGLKMYNKQMHGDLPAVVGTKLRGYYQKNNGTAQGAGTDHSNQYLGPLIIANRDIPVRIKFFNELPTGSAGNLPLPVDTTVMGAGMGPFPAGCYNNNPPNCVIYSQNRADLHLHGGLTPWISDGTPHQWVTPAGDLTPYKKGLSFQNVPDMVNGSVVNGTPVSCIGGTACFTPAIGDGIGTYYYPNQQSARLMFYHDHAYGITRLNVYAGEAAGYLLTDNVEQALITGPSVNPDFTAVFTAMGLTPKKILPDIGIPLVIQDKTFVNDLTTPPHASFAATGGTPTPTTLAVDPLWYTHVPASVGGDLWLPHEYLPNENIYDPSGFYYMGRWDYGPWILPPMLVQDPILPSPSIVPEAFADTMIVNGTAFPYVELPPSIYRFRILNACNDRMLNLQLYYAATAAGTICRGGAVLDQSLCTEVSMVPASPNPLYDTWPKDGRDGGVPDPTTMGPDWWQIGNEAGFLAKVAVIPPQPVDYDYDRTSATFGNVSSTSLYLVPAVRGDVIVDFSGVTPGDTLILYNDAPAPMPLFDDRYDYFTDSKDWTPKGGAPTPKAGFGPNTRTIMQIRIKGDAVPSTVNLTDLQAYLPKAFAVSQDQILVPQAAYNAAYGTAYPDYNGGLTNFANVADYSVNVSGATQPVARVITELPGFGYTTPPTVSFYGGFPPGCVAPTCTVATATAALNGVTGVTLLTAGSGYTSPPTVTFTGGGGTGATATATVSGGVVTFITITNPGRNYTTAPIVSITGGGGFGATATAIITRGSVGSITVTNPGSGYIKAPYVYLTGGRGTGAAAIALLNGSMVLNGKTLVEGMDMEFGRMNAVLGSLPNPLAPTVGAGPFLGAAFYIDPPTEILNAGEPILWRISHIGVDSHAIHFHLFNVQVVNRVDWTNTVKPPYEEELGWKETIRTNPFEDIIVAIRPMRIPLPFPIPLSNRLLDVTTPAGSTLNFQPVLPPIGLPAVAQISNVMTNFGWEYVWHCHLLGHEENDMMRPIVFVIPPPVRPTGLAATVSFPNPPPARVTLTWGPAAIDPNTDGYILQRATNNSFTAGLTTTTIPGGNATKTYIDNTVAQNARYYYRVRAFSGSTNSAWSNVVTAITVPPPGNFAATVTPFSTSSDRVTLTWTATGTISSFTLQRATNSSFTTGLSTSYITGTARSAIQYVSRPRTYYYRIRTNVATGFPSSEWSPTLTVVAP